MRPRRGFSVLSVGVLAAVLSVSAVAPTPAAGQGDQVQRGVGLEGLLQSLVDGDNPLITPVESTEVTSPLGGTTADTPGTATLTGTFEFTANVGRFEAPADLDFDGNVDIPADLERLMTGAGGFEAAVLDGVLSPTLERTAPVFEGSPVSVFDRLHLDPTDGGVQDFNGTPIRIAGDMNGNVPTLGVVDIWGGTFAGPLPPDLSCKGDIHEFGRAFLVPGGKPWVPQVAVNDTFRDVSNAVVTRCNNGFWYVDSLVNNGSSFSSTPTNSFSLVWPTGWVTFTDRRETATIVQDRMFAFRTPLVGGYQQSNTFQTTEPAYPGLRMPTGPFLVGTPVATEFGPFAFDIDLTLDPGAPIGCPPGWSAPYELFVDRSSQPGANDVVLHQFPSGQLTIGVALLSADGNLRVETEGTGDGYHEMFVLDGGDRSSYVYSPDGFVCPYGLDWVAQQSVAEALTGSGLGPVVAPEEEGPAATEQPGQATPQVDGSATGPTEGTATESDDGLPWEPIAIGLGLLFLTIGFGITRTRGKDRSPSPTAPATVASTTGPTRTTTITVMAEGRCERLRRLYAQAQADADAKRRDATDAQTAAESAGESEDAANAAAGNADQAAEDAKTARERAERDRDRPPAGEEDAWIEDSTTGERITGRDLRLRREAAAEAWDDYRADPSPESADQTQQDWKDLDGDGARVGRRAADDADQAARQAALDAATTAETAANDAKSEADQALSEAEKASGDARAQAARAEQEATEAETRAATLKRQLDECLAMTGGTPTRWGGPMGLSEDCDGGCFPEGNVERRVLDTFDRTVKVNHWVTVRPTSDARSEARRLSGELRWWRDMFATTSSAINVAGALKGLVTRTAKDAVETAVSGASVVAGEKLDIDIPTTIYQVPVVALEGAAAASAAIIDKWGEWIERNHVEWVAEWGYQIRDCKLAWVEIWKCEDGVKNCVERVLEVDISAPRLTGAVNTETYQPNENWRPRVDGLTHTHATRVQSDSQLLTEFMQKHAVGPCGG